MPVFRVEIERERKTSFQGDQAYAVEVQRCAGCRGEDGGGGEVDDAVDGADLGLHGAARVLKEEAGVEGKRGLGHPYDRGGEAGCSGGWQIDGGEQVAAGDVDLVGQRDRDGERGRGFVQVAVKGDDAGDTGAAS